MYALQGTVRSCMPRPSRSRPTWGISSSDILPAKRVADDGLVNQRYVPASVPKAFATRLLRADIVGQCLARTR